MPIIDIVIERFLHGITPAARTPLLVAMWCTTWGAGILALVAGWTTGTAWLLVFGTACVIGRNLARRGQRGAVTTSDDPATLEERVLARLSSTSTATEAPDDAEGTSQANRGATN